MGLTLNEQKTRVCDGRREEFTFLGYTFGPIRKGGNSGAPPDLYTTALALSAATQ